MGLRQIGLIAAGLALLAVLAAGGDLIVARLGLVLPGSVLGLGAYLLLLSTGRFGWSLGAARLVGQGCPQDARRTG